MLFLPQHFVDQTITPQTSVKTAVLMKVSDGLEFIRCTQVGTPRFSVWLQMQTLAPALGMRSDNLRRAVRRWWQTAGAQRSTAMFPFAPMHEGARGQFLLRLDSLQNFCRWLVEVASTKQLQERRTAAIKSALGWVSGFVPPPAWNSHLQEAFEAMARLRALDPELWSRTVSPASTPRTPPRPVARERKPDTPLAESTATAVDLNQTHFTVEEAASLLGCTPRHLLRVLKDELPGLQPPVPPLCREHLLRLSVVIPKASQVRKKLFEHLWGLVKLNTPVPAGLPNFEDPVEAALAWVEAKRAGQAALTNERMAHQDSITRHKSAMDLMEATTQFHARELARLRQAACQTATAHSRDSSEDPSAANDVGNVIVASQEMRAAGYITIREFRQRLDWSEVAHLSTLDQSRVLRFHFFSKFQLADGKPLKREAFKDEHCVRVRKVLVPDLNRQDRDIKTPPWRWSVWYNPSYISKVQANLKHLVRAWHQAGSPVHCVTRNGAAHLQVDEEDQG